jgi:hypothetical protein
MVTIIPRLVICGDTIRLHCECVSVCVCVRESVRESVSSKSE